MIYTDAIKYLESFINYERRAGFLYGQSFKLERMKSFLEAIGSPQKKLNVIHVAGSKGKGSVCAFIAYILREAGFKVGLYTSPHLNDFRERIRILKQTTNDRRQTTDFEGMISKQDICNYILKLKPTIDKFNRSAEIPGFQAGDECAKIIPTSVGKLSQENFPTFYESGASRETSGFSPRRFIKTSKYGALTFFEAYTALAFQYFKERKTDFVVLETGLGGRLDATNTCDSLVSVITPLSYEHTYLLGKTLKKITFEKAAIIKSENKVSTIGKRLVLSAKQDKEAMAVIEKIAHKNNALLFKENRDFKFVMKDSSFDYAGINYKIDNLKIKLKGRHQIQNACLAIASIEALGYHNIKINKDVIRNGLKRCLWPARFEIISKAPLIIIDGAHNSASMIVLRKTLREFFPHKKVWVIFGISQDKELKDTCREIEKFNARIILTKADNPRAAEPQRLLRYFSNNSILLTHSTSEALNLAKSKIKKDDLILVTGSLFVCGEVRQLLNR